MENGRCQMHGGKSLKGIASPTFQSGRYSKFLPLSLSSGYEAAKADPDALSISDEIALTQVRLEELLQRLSTSDLGNAWLDVDAALETFVQCRTAGDVSGMGRALAKLEAGVKAGRTQHALWEDILDKVRLISDLRLREHKRLIDLGSMVSSERANIIFGVLLQATRSAVLAHTDPTTARAILSAIQETIRVVDTRSVAQPRLSAAE